MNFFLSSARIVMIGQGFIVLSENGKIVLD